MEEVAVRQDVAFPNESSVEKEVSSVPSEEHTLLGDELEIPATSVATSPKFQRTLETIEAIFAQNEGIVSRGEFEQKLRAKGLYSPRAFYKFIKQIRAKKFAAAIQKRDQPFPRKAETYYVSPGFYEIHSPLDLFTIMHNFCAQEAKNFLSVTCAIKDMGRHELEGGVIRNDFRVKFGSRITYIEYTSGGCAAMRAVIRKIKESRRKCTTVLLVGLEEPPRRQQSGGVGITSNRQEALEIAAELEVELRVFMLTNLEELEAYCMRGKLPYSHPKGR